MQNYYHALILVLFFCGPVMAQQTALVELGDRNDPCAQFKMRILVPADFPNRGLRMESTSPSIDPKMAWNPCRGNELQIAATAPGAPKRRYNFFVVSETKPLLPHESKREQNSPNEPVLLITPWRTQVVGSKPILKDPPK